MKHDEEIEITSEFDQIDSVDSAPVKHLSIKPKKKRHVVRNIIITLLVLAVLAAGGYIGYLLIKPLEPGATEPATPVKIAPLSATALTGQIKLKMTGKIKITDTDADGSVAKTYTVPNYKPDGYDFAVQPTKDTGFMTFSTTDVAKKDLEQIELTLVAHQLEKTVLDAGSAYSMYVALYESPTIICLVSDQKPAYADGQFNTILGCADKAAYIDNVKILKPYFTVYAAESGNNTVQVAMSLPVIKESQTPGYATMQIGIGDARYGSVGGFAGLFYQTPDKVIHYFTGTQSQIACTAYKTPDLKKAYLGESCFDSTNSKAIVKL